MKSEDNLSFSAKMLSTFQQNEIDVFFEKNVIFIKPQSHRACDRGLSETDFGCYLCDHCNYFSTTDIIADQSRYVRQPVTVHMVIVLHLVGNKSWLAFCAC